MPHSQTTKWGKATPSASHFNHLDLWVLTTQGKWVVSCVPPRRCISKYKRAMVVW
jgi:hypothetical protein